MLPSCHGRPHHTTVSIGIPAAQSWFAPAAAATVHATVAARATWMGWRLFSAYSSFVGGETTFSLATTRFSRRIWAFLAAAGHHLNDVPVRFTTLRTTKQAWKIHENTTTGVSPRRGATSRHSTPEQLTCATSAALPLPPTSSVLPHLEVAVLAARGDVAAVGAPVDRVDLVGVAGQLLLELAGLHRPHLDRRVLGAAREQSAVA